jgi:hypothetical protein
MLIAFPKELMQSIRDNSYQAWRSWTASFKRGGSTLPVILTLAFAIGSTTAMFVLIKGVLTGTVGTRLGGSGSWSQGTAFVNP